MKKACKVLTLILVVVMLFGLLSGCAMFGTDSQKYRAAVAIKVGDQEVTVGKVLDTFNSLYSTYYQYINAGYMSASDLLSSTITTLYTQNVKLDAYVKTHTAETHSYASQYENAGFLSAEEMEYTVKNVKYLIFTSFDSSVETLISNKYGELAAEETEDTSRDFVTTDEWSGTESYAEYLYKQNYANEDMEEYLKKYYPSLGTAGNLKEYVLSGSIAQKRVAEYNERIDEEKGQLTVDEYKTFQQRIVKRYTNNVKTSYDISLEEFFKRQVEDNVVANIGLKYDYEITKTVDDKLNDVFAALNDNVTLAKENLLANFALNGGFESFVENLSDSDYLYAVDGNSDYIFVKNILVKFSDEQNTILTNLSNAMGGTDSKAYVARREQIAADIIATDYNTAKNEDGEYGKVEGKLFKLDADGNIALNLANPVWNEYLNADGTVKGADKNATMKELMKRFNEDTASHSKIYDYTVRVGDIPEDYNSGLVQEYFDAAQKLFEGGVAKVGEYVTCVTTYGVHIIYCVGKVEAHTFDFAANYNDTASPEYRLFKAYYSTQTSEVLEETYETVRNEYYKNKISVTDAFYQFLEDNGLTFDVEASLSTAD